jgi:hypothetical protein
MNFEDKIEEKEFHTSCS